MILQFEIHAERAFFDELLPTGNMRVKKCPLMTSLDSRAAGPPYLERDGHLGTTFSFIFKLKLIISAVQKHLRCRKACSDLRKPHLSTAPKFRPWKKVTIARVTSGPPESLEPDRFSCCPRDQSLLYTVDAVSNTAAIGTVSV